MFTSVVNGWQCSDCGSVDASYSPHNHTHRNTAAMSTDYLWNATHSALLDGRWSVARALLDDLGRRSDVVDSLLSVDQYVKVSGKPLHPDYVAILADRIDLVNSKI